jgi:hypothetical protein
MCAFTDLSATPAAIFDCELHRLRAASRGIAHPVVLHPDRRRSCASPADDQGAMRPVFLVNMRNICAFGQKLLSPSTFPASHLSHKSSDRHLRHRLRTSRMMASVSPCLATSGSTPARVSMCIMRLPEAAARYLENHTTRATLTATMNMATAIWNNVGFMVQFSY